MAKSDPQNAPYKVSRAALRERYGARAIDASAPQSSRDTTPSGREAFARQQGATKEEAAQYAADLFHAPFQNKQQITDQPKVASMSPVKEQRQMFAGGYASPEDVGTLRSQGATGTVRTQYGTITLPATLPASDMAEFLPATNAPLNSFSLPKPKPYLGSILQAASKWARTI